MNDILGEINLSVTTSSGGRFVGIGVYLKPLCTEKIGIFCFTKADLHVEHTITALMSSKCCKSKQ